MTKCQFDKIESKFKEVSGIMSCIELEQSFDYSNPTKAGSNYSSYIVSLEILITILHITNNTRELVNWYSVLRNAVNDYFFGEWKDKAPSGNYHKDPPSRVYQDITSAWDDQLSMGLITAFVLHDWELFNKLVLFPRDEICLDIDQHQCNRAWLIGLCRFMSGAPQKVWEMWLNDVQFGDKKRERILAACIYPLAEKNTPEFSKCLQEYLNYFVKSEFRKNNSSKFMSKDASILWHYANHIGLNVPLPDKYPELLYRLPSSNE
jgi:hypothetical protein